MKKIFTFLLFNIDTISAAAIRDRIPVITAWSGPAGPADNGPAPERFSGDTIPVITKIIAREGMNDNPYVFSRITLISIDYDGGFFLIPPEPEPEPEPGPADIR
jgi:hypothetical protein